MNQVVIISINRSSKYRYFKIWNDFYYGALNNTEKKNTIQTFKQNFTSENIYIHDVKFHSITDSDQGGALKFSITGGTNSLLIEKCLFFLCKVTSDAHGGAVYFNNYGHCQFHKICSYNCTISGSGCGIFCYCYTNTNNKYNISMIFSSIIASSYSPNGYNLLFFYGTKTITTTNFSNNIHGACCPVYEFRNYISYTSYCK
jgi:hypothetical protein